MGDLERLGNSCIYTDQSIALWNVRSVHACGKIHVKVVRFSSSLFLWENCPWTSAFLANSHFFLSVDLHLAWLFCTYPLVIARRFLWKAEMTCCTQEQRWTWAQFFRDWLKTMESILCKFLFETPTSFKSLILPRMKCFFFLCCCCFSQNYFSKTFSF